MHVTSQLVSMKPKPPNHVSLWRALEVSQKKRKKFVRCTMYDVHSPYSRRPNSNSYEILYRKPEEIDGDVEMV